MASSHSSSSSSSTVSQSVSAVTSKRKSSSTSSPPSSAKIISSKTRASQSLSTATSIIPGSLNSQLSHTNHLSSTVQSSTSSKTNYSTVVSTSAQSVSSSRYPLLSSVYTKYQSKSSTSTTSYATHSTKPPGVTPSSFHTRIASSDIGVLKTVAVVLSLLVLLVGLVIIFLTMMYCKNGQWSRRRKMDLRKKASQLFNTNGHRGFTKVRTFDPDASDEGDEMTIFSKL